MAQSRSWERGISPIDLPAPRSAWTGAEGLRAERGRSRLRFRVIGIVAVLFLYGLALVRLGTESAARSSRINALKSALKKVEVDLTVGQARLDSRQIYGVLLPAAEQSGFGGGGQHRTIAVNVARPRTSDPLATQVAQELKAGAEMLLPAALAQEVRAAGTKRAHRP